MVKANFNLDSPNNIHTPCDFNALDAWFESESATISEEPIRRVVLDVAQNLEHFARWPKKAILLWSGRMRGPRKYHRYPDIVKKLVKYADLKQRVALITSRPCPEPGPSPRRIKLDTRINGPAVVAFAVAGGIRPHRFGSTNAWSIHHLYSGKFPYVGRDTTLHASKHGLHFTQSAGLVAIHPIADQMCDEFPFFAWLLRAHAFQRFGYDPDHVFASSDHDQYGFCGNAPFVVPVEERNGAIKKKT